MNGRWGRAIWRQESQCRVHSNLTDGDRTRIADEGVRCSDSWSTLAMLIRQFEFICVVGEKGRGNPMVLIMGLFWCVGIEIVSNRAWKSVSRRDFILIGSLDLRQVDLKCLLDLCYRCLFVCLYVFVRQDHMWPGSPQTHYVNDHDLEFLILLPHLPRAGIKVMYHILDFVHYWRSKPGLYTC